MGKCENATGLQGSWCEPQTVVENWKLQMNPEDMALGSL